MRKSWKWEDSNTEVNDLAAYIYIYIVKYKLQERKHQTIRAIKLGKIPHEKRHKPPTQNESAENICVIREHSTFVILCNS